MERGTVANLVASLLGFAVLMLVLLSVLGFGVGTVELAIWLLLLATGAALIVRRHRNARAGLEAKTG
jgi:hypothetical protein